MLASALKRFSSSNRKCSSTSGVNSRNACRDIFILTRLTGLIDLEGRFRGLAAEEQCSYHHILFKSIPSNTGIWSGIRVRSMHSSGIKRGNVICTRAVQIKTAKVYHLKKCESETK